MVNIIIILLFLIQVGCSGFATYTIVTAGTLSGEILHDAVNDYKENKEDNAITTPLPSKPKKD